MKEWKKNGHNEVLLFNDDVYVSFVGDLKSVMAELPEEIRKHAPEKELYNKTNQETCLTIRQPQGELPIQLVLKGDHREGYGSLNTKDELINYYHDNVDEYGRFMNDLSSLDMYEIAHKEMEINPELKKLMSKLLIKGKY